MSKKVVLASSNQGKLKELQALLSLLEMELISQDELNVPSVAETGLTFVENALIKARNACQHTGLPAVADDSGIEIKALQSRPGIYSARYAGEGASDQQNNDKLLAELRDIAQDQRQARYVCVIVYMRHANDPTPIMVQGFWNGIIHHVPRGSGGFGYDPLFYLPDLHCTSAELTAEHKNQLSHRGQALRQLVQALREL